VLRFDVFGTHQIFLSIHFIEQYIITVLSKIRNSLKFGHVLRSKQLQTNKMQKLIEIRNHHLTVLGIKFRGHRYFLPNGQTMEWENVIMMNNTEYLAKYGEFRKEIVDSILDFCLLQTKCTDECTLQKAGSTNLTSDYDITLNGVMAAEAHECFENTFYKLFGDTSPVVFDTNVYGVGFFEPLPVAMEADFQSEVNSRVPTFSKSKRNRSTIKGFTFFPYIDNDEVKHIKYISLAKEDINTIKNQRIWAFVKFLMYADVDFRTISEEKGGNVLFWEDLEEARKIKAQLDNVRGNIEEIYSNLLYEVADIFLEFEDVKDKDLPELKRKYQNAISEANYYGSETYLTRGAFFHVVGRMQVKIDKLPISTDEYIDSYIENIADVLKTVDRFETTPCRELIVEISKYYYRAKDAWYNIVKNMKLGDKIAEMAEKSRDIANEIRLKIRGKTVCGRSTERECVKEDFLDELYQKFLDVDKSDCMHFGDHVLANFVDDTNLIYSQ